MTANLFSPIRWIRVHVLRFRAIWIQGQIEHAEAMLLDHKARLQNCYSALRKVKAREAMITPANTLLEQALRRKN